MGIRVRAKAYKSADPISLSLWYPSLSHEAITWLDTASSITWLDTASLSMNQLKARQALTRLEGSWEVRINELSARINSFLLAWSFLAASLALFPLLVGFVAQFIPWPRLSTHLSLLLLFGRPKSFIFVWWDDWTPHPWLWCLTDRNIVWYKDFSAYEKLGFVAAPPWSERLNLLVTTSGKWLIYTFW